MPLKNARHERFAQGIAKGKTIVDAYKAAGFKPDDGNASRLADRPDVQARIQALTGRAAEAAVVEARDVLLELKKIGFANMADYMRFDDGKPYLDFSALTREQAAAIAELHVETIPGGEIRPDVTKVRFKLADKRAALVDLGKHLGLFKEQVEHSGKVEITIAGDDASLL